MFISLLNLADKLDIDLLDAVLGKFEKNRRKYPVRKARGKKNNWVDYRDGESSGET